LLTAGFPRQPAGSPVRYEVVELDGERLETGSRAACCGRRLTGSQLSSPVTRPA